MFWTRFWAIYSQTHLVTLILELAAVGTVASETELHDLSEYKV
jgi:hypothetical protein